MPAIFCHSCGDNRTATKNRDTDDLECDECESSFVEASGQAGIEQFKPATAGGEGGGEERVRGSGENLKPS